MRLQLSDLWIWQGRISRGEYAFWGILLFGLKYAADRIVAEVLFDRSWSVLNYISPLYARHVFTNIKVDFYFYLTLATVALPFIAIGTALAVRRLRDIN